MLDALVPSTEPPTPDVWLLVLERRSVVGVIWVLGCLLTSLVQTNFAVVIVHQAIFRQILWAE